MADGTLTSLHVGESSEEGGALLTRVDAVVNWARKNSIWPLPLGLSCCAIEFMATAASRFDMARFGAEAPRFSPRQSDLLWVVGTISQRQAPLAAGGRAGPSALPAAPLFASCASSACT